MMKSFLRPFSMFTLALYLLQATQVHAADAQLESLVSRMRSQGGGGLPEAQAAEYVLRRYPGEKLMPVRILGGVNRPGIYYLPEGTDLLTALSLSAGVDKDADGDRVHWNKGGNSEGKIMEMQELVHNPKRFNPTLTANDLVFIEKKEPWISNNTVLVLGAITSVVGIVLGTIAIKNAK